MINIIKKLIKFDHSYSERIFKLQPRSTILKKVITFVTIGYGLVPFTLIAIIASKNIYITLALFLLILLINFFIVEGLIKRKVRRKRPVYKENQKKSHSFPSTHATGTTMMFLHLLLTPELYSLTPLIAFTIAFLYVFILITRVLYGHHYIVDIIVGIVLGLMLYLPILIFIKI